MSEFCRANVARVEAFSSTRATIPVQIPEVQSAGMRAARGLQGRLSPSNSMSTAWEAVGETSAREPW
eukprot:CAMPEP_0205884964 /NCGR_PEP_ID=MMETSP1083-20121108/18404_1 /ASSEMBLY_ACC=CAM_ASM_000430 /TAXON_ID=97485 /ORGANISM="Prymnesium parvum, Strain Texoma1" /LENGTH=66 /DNA_ID=CAMNT_0053248411 /DNA_START=531 /DNA_END=731 /DNA_ORIENTATION=-